MPAEAHTVVLSSPMALVAGEQVKLSNTRFALRFTDTTTPNFDADASDTIIFTVVAVNEDKFILKVNDVVRASGSEEISFQVGGLRDLVLEHNMACRFTKVVI